MPRLKLPQHDRIGQEIEIAACRPWTHAERPGGLRCVPDLPIVVSNHGPEPEQGDCRYAHTPLGKIALEQGLDELLAPGDAVALASSEVGPRKPAPAPKRIGRIRAELGHGEPADLDPFHAPGQGPRALPEQVARCVP